MLMALLFHTVVQPEPTGSPGRPRSPEKLIDASLDYATVHKTRENGRVVKVEKNVVFGSEGRIKMRLEDSPVLSSVLCEFSEYWQIGPYLPDPI